MRPEVTRSVAPRPAPHQQYVPIPRPVPGGRSLYEGEPEACRRDLWKFLAIWAHLGLLMAVLLIYRVEGRGFQRLVGLAVAVLPLHYLVPYRWKKRVLVATSLAGLAWVFGPTIAAVVLLFSALLIGLALAPFAWWIRAALIAGVAVAVGVARGLYASSVADCVWPLVATLFMFRMVIYLYELKHAEKRESLLDTLSYFFLLPNFCFLHFPVVDYRTFHRSYFAADVHSVQRTGLRMMFRGTSHLLLYRLVYHELLIPPDRVHNLASLAGFVVCNYLLYLRVSGQFHMACGMLHLFGFQLPETHRHYLLATSFTDYWRRINIYWKDFMVRVVFNPVVFRLKRWPQPVALSVATAAVFLTTWLLHVYQSYWLRGTWGFSLHDALFWGILGLLVMINVQLDARAPRGRSRKGFEGTPRAVFVRLVKTAATFTTIALLWSLWSSPGVSAWLEMLGRGLRLHG